MTRAEFDEYCRALIATEHVVQWGDASVWKIGGKIFAICPKADAGDDVKISFKCSDLSYRLLCEQPGIIPAPYLARAKWLQVENDQAMEDQDLRAYIEAAYFIIMAKLTKAKRKQLGLSLPSK